MFSNATKKNTLSFVDLLSQNRSHKSIASGVAFGVMIGLLPKDNLLTLVLIVLIAVLPLNQLIACISSGIVTLFGSSTAFLVDWVGYQILRQRFVAELLGAIYQIPLVPWLRLENTLVAGSLVIGGLLWLPTYFIVYRTSKRVYRSISETEVAQLAAASLRHKSSREFDQQLLIASSPSVALPQSQERLPENQNEDVVIDASNGSLLVTDHPLEDSNLTKVQNTIEPSNNQTGLETDEESILRETLIEVIRYKRQTFNALPEVENNTSSTPDHETMKLTSYLQPVPSVPALSDNSTPSKTGTRPLSGNGTGYYRSHVGTKEDSLRHIIKHIHGTRESKKEVEQST